MITRQKSNATNVRDRAGMQGENGSGAPRISDRASAMASPHEADNELKSLDFPDCPCLDGSMS